ncbi:phosphatidylinositol-specific phospholipase C1-like protein [Phenylobacterium sp.]|uniref:phosphatidylinositol-specific phospholipase C1-like protein n=1 Tax=Phenylobacterium sp. TaxID=1871053 RepID=UPI002E3416C3|nr:phosphatidylinositol-specific phospholipase C1-like protein [Phenylobacterium sp.]HEX3366231.1 phosphatidylinositol-specific phospholipase C1-like protein [Phenylobacterium sp.]
MSRSYPVLAGAAACALAIVGAAAAAGSDEGLRINQLQVIGSHNSYHAGLTPGVAKLLQATNPKAFDGLDYQHSPLTAQFDHGIRQIELDIYADAKGGRFAHPFGATLNEGGAAGFDKPGVFAKPGFKVMHVQDIDYISTCQPFVGCLKEVRAWSKAHPQHVPLYILVETKTQEPIKAVPGMVDYERFTGEVLDALDAEIRSVFPENEMVTPDQVRGHYATLPEAVGPHSGKEGGWPTLKSARGKVVFLLDQSNITPIYTAGHPALQGRVLFTNAKAGTPDAAFVEQNEGTPEAIAALVKQGYIVRTCSDADTKEGRSGDTTQREKALGSGAQMVSTDYPWFEPSRWTGFTVSLPGTASVRCNPVNAPKGCSDAALGDTPVAK